jgi:glycosyltransferase involved in cell wall biosynthesis
MKLVVTVMVRDEVDIIAAMVEHHVAQGVDLIIATDNGSVDGTTEVLQRYADRGVLELHHDPVQRKQQHSVVTGMARRAHTEHGADWVINADADEFWVPADKRRTLRSALEAIPLSLNAFTVPVTNLVGPPATRGSGVDRLLWRDVRTNEQLQAIGIYAQPTSDVVHRGDPAVEVAQGNHFVSLESAGQPDPALALEVLHLPWRSWLQFEQKVISAGRAYEANPDLRPSKNHHGMADYRRYLAGRLWFAFLLRQPMERDLAGRESDGAFVHDPWLRKHLHELVDRALWPELLAACLDSSRDEPIDPGEHERAAALGRLFMGLEQERDEARKLVDERDRALAARDRQKAAAPAPRIRDDWVRVSRRTLGAIKRRVRGGMRRG